MTNPIPQTRQDMQDQAVTIGALLTAALTLPNDDLSDEAISLVEMAVTRADSLNKALDSLNEKRTEKPKTHRHYEFGTFDERLAHLCALFETDPPEIVYENGRPEMSDGLMEWIKQHNINMDWLFAGSPCALLRKWSEDLSNERNFMDTHRQLEPEVQAGMQALLRAVVINKLPLEEPLQVFSDVVKDWRAGKAA